MTESQQKECSLNGAKYNVGSFSDIIHQFIEASSKEELEKIKAEMVMENRLQELLQYSQGVVSEFVPHFSERFKAIEIESDAWHLEIDKWNWTGQLLGRLGAFGALRWAESIYKSLYSILCDLQQEKRRRINKGTPLHNTGWVDLIRGTPESLKRSQFFMKLAMIEDVISVKDGFKNLPAYRVLNGEHNIPEANLDRLAEVTNGFRKEYEEQNWRPELIYLYYVIDRDNKERSGMYELDPKLGCSLLKSTKDAVSNDAKGKSLEILMAYLFLTCNGFEVLHNLKSMDSQHDLLIRNLNTTDPILSEFGKYLFVECRNIEDRVDAKAIRDFTAKVIQASCNSGILIAKSGITGDVEGNGARMAILKNYQRHDVVIVSLTLNQLENLIDQRLSLIDLLVHEYEKVRFDLQ